MLVKNRVYQYCTFYVLGACCFLFQASVAHASSTAKYSACFKQAETYYEQIYCEIKAKGQGDSLPSFIDFKKNTEQMQALLLKRKAEALNIPFTMQQKTSEITNNETTKKVIPENSVPEKNEQVIESIEMAHSSDCEYLERTIKCLDGVFSIVGNKRNSEIERVALSSENKLGLDEFTGDRNNKIQVIDYLTKSYAHYIKKMLEIGLAGETMSFTKFYYFFQDLSEKGLSFQQRFETMYAYLKADKRSLGVTQAVKAIEGITIAQCSRLNHDVFTCDNVATNRVYVR